MAGPTQFPEPRPPNDGDKFGLIVQKLDSLQHDVAMIKVSLNGLPDDPQIGMAHRIRELERFASEQEKRNTVQNTLLLQVKILWASIGTGLLTFIYHKLTT